jgi:hypothetical protein
MGTIIIIFLEYTALHNPWNKDADAGHDESGPCTVQPFFLRVRGGAIYGVRPFRRPGDTDTRGVGGSASWYNKNMMNQEGPGISWLNRIRCGTRADPPPVTFDRSRSALSTDRRQGRHVWTR